MASLRPAIDQTSEKTTQTGNQHMATHMFHKWGPLIFCLARTWGYPAAWRKEWTLGSSITLNASLKGKKDGEIGGKQMAKRINYRKKNHVTCQIYTLFYVELRCWNWILKTLYIINTFQASSVWGFLLRPVLKPQKSNKQFVHDICSHFNLTLVRI